MKRIGHVWEELVSTDNCEKAVLRAVRNKKKTRFLKYVKAHYKEYGERLHDDIVNGWQPEPVRTKTINEGTDHKTRDLEIPSLRDHFVHTMDNYVMMASRKRTLHKTIRTLMAIAEEYGLEIKEDWQVFPIKSRMIPFLSYRIDHERTIIRKPLMYRMARRFHKANKHLNAHTARTIMSYRGILKYCDSYNFRKSYLYPNVSLRMRRRLISNADKKRVLCGTA